MATALMAYALSGWLPDVASSPLEPAPESPQSASPGSAPASDATDRARARAAKAGIDVDSVVDTVRHRVTPAADGSGAYAARDEHYTARFDAQGFGLNLGHASSDLGVSLSGARRGGAELALTLEAWRGEANVAQRDVGSALTERVTSRAGELEWDVVLAHPLPGTGALRLHADLHGLDGVPERLSGPPAWRLPLGSGHAARLGEIVAKDATGRELYRSLPHVHGDQIDLEVPAWVLTSARYPLTIDPTVGPELSVDDPVYGAADDFQQTPAIASNGSDYLVVWEDRRGGDLSDYEIFATRVSAAGVVLDTTGIPISAATGVSERGPAVASNGTDYLVVWHDFRGGVNFDIYGTRVSAAGSVLDPSGVPISTATGGQTLSAVAWNGANFLVVWEDRRAAGGNELDIYGARVSAAGSVLDPSGFPISTAVNYQIKPAVASNGADFLVVWDDRRNDFSVPDIYGARVSGAGVALDPAGIAVSTAAGTQQAPAVAASGTDYLVVWEDSRSPSIPDIYGSRVSSAGMVLDPGGIAMSPAAGDGREPAIAWNGTDLLVVYISNTDVYGTRVNVAGSVLDPGGIAIATDAVQHRTPAVASDDTDFLVSWDHRISGSHVDVYGARVNAAGSVLDAAGFIMSTSANDQRAPEVAWNGSEFLIVWEDRRARDAVCCFDTFVADIYGTRVSAAGAVLDPAGIAISTAASDQRAPAVAWNGTDFLVVWQDYRSGQFDVYGTRVSAGGGVLEPAGTPISTAANEQMAPDVAWNGTNFLVVWQDARTLSYDVYSARVSAAGVVLDPSGLPVSTAASSQWAPSVAWNGTHFLVVWNDFRSGSNVDIYGARMTGAGSVVDASGIPISTATNDQSAPAVASWSDHFFVVWQDKRSGANTDIYGAGVSAAGVVQQPAGIAISTASGNQEAPDLAVRYDFFVVWRDRRAGNYDVYGTRVSPAFVVDQPGGLPVSVSATDEGAPAVSGGPGTTWLVGYQRFAPQPPYGANRVFLRSVSPK